MKTRITPDIISDAKALAAKGYSNSIISDALKIGYNTLWNNEGLRVAIKEGRAEARQRVVDMLMVRSEEDQSSTAAIFMAKQLKVFDDPFTTATPKTAKEAVQRMEDIYQAVAAGELTEEKGTHLIGYLEKYIRAHEVSVLEKRIEALEESINVEK